MAKNRSFFTIRIPMNHHVRDAYFGGNLKQYIIHMIDMCKAHIDKGEIEIKEDESIN